MKRFFLLLMTLTLITFTFVPIAGAQMVDEEEVGKFTVGGVLGIVGSGMGDINSNLRVVGDFLDITEVKRMDSINLSMLTGLDVRYKLRPNLSLGFTWGSLQNRSELDVDRVQARFFSRATTYTASAYYHIPEAEDWDERLQVYGGAGYMLLRSGRVEWAFTDNTDNFWNSEFPPEGLPGDIAELSGRGKAAATGTGFHLTVGSSYQLTYRMSAALDLGYRGAKLTEFTYDDADFLGEFERFTAEDLETREPGDWAIYDFFFRDLDAETPDGRSRNDRHDDPTQGKTGCRDCPLYYEGGQVEIDYSGFYAQFAIRFHIF